ncbi:MAG: ABC transporter permease [Tunicatimonas sp.]
MKDIRKDLTGQSSNIILYACGLYYIIAALTTPGFFTVNNTWNLLYNWLPLLIVAIGQTFVILTAGIDLSVTSIIAVSSVVGGYLMSSDYSPLGNTTLAIVAGVVGMLLSGIVIGFINGFAVAKLKMPAFMVTLTSLMFFSGFVVWLTTSQNIYNLPEAFVNLPYSTFLWIPVPLWIGLLVLLLAYLVLNRSLYGEWIYAVGVSPKTSRISGVNVSFTLILVYVISGMCAAVGAVLYTARLETGSPVMGQNVLLDVIGAVVIGGTSLFGGKGLLQWTVAGAFFMTMLDNSLNLAGLSFFLIMIVKGIIILLAALLNVLRERITLTHA